MLVSTVDRSRTTPTPTANRINGRPPVNCIGNGTATYQKIRTAETQRTQRKYKETVHLAPTLQRGSQF